MSWALITEILGAAIPVFKIVTPVFLVIFVLKTIMKLVERGAEARRDAQDLQEAEDARLDFERDRRRERRDATRRWRELRRSEKARRTDSS